VLGGDLLELLHPSRMLLREIPLLADFSLERDGSPPMAAKLVFGLFEQLLVPLQHPPLLPVCFEQLGEIQPQPRLGGGGLLELGLQRAG
jgi:hypothetical protein